MEPAVLEEKTAVKVYCRYHRAEILKEECIKSFINPIIRSYCLQWKCESPAKPCITCVEQEIKQPADQNAEYFFAEKGKELCLFHNKHGTEVNPEIELLKDFIPVEEIKPEKEKEENMKEKEVVEIVVSAISIREKKRRRLERFIKKLQSKSYEPVRVKMTGENQYKASINPACSYYNEKMVAAARQAGINTIQAIITQGKRRKTKLAETVGKTKLAVKVTDTPDNLIELLLDLTPEALRAALEKKMTSQLDTVINTCDALSSEAKNLKAKIKK